MRDDYYTGRYACTEEPQLTEGCSYFFEKEGYVLFTPAGLIGSYIYSSKENKWHYD